MVVGAVDLVVVNLMVVLVVGPIIIVVGPDLTVVEVTVDLPFNPLDVAIVVVGELFQKLSGPLVYIFEMRG